jgi:hypothetical protein
MQEKGAISGSMEILDRELFNRLNEKYSKLAQDKYKVANKGLLFNMQVKTVPRLERVPYYRENTKQVIKAVPNDKMFEELQYNYDLFEENGGIFYQLNETHQEVPSTGNFMNQLTNFFNKNGFKLSIDVLKDYREFFDFKSGIDLIQKEVFLPSEDFIPTKEAAVLGVTLLKKTEEYFKLSKHIKAWDQYADKKRFYIQEVKNRGRIFGNEAVEIAEMYVMYDFVENYIVPNYDKLLKADKTYKKEGALVKKIREVSFLEKAYEYFNKMMRKLFVLKPSFQEAEASAKKIAAEILNNSINFEINKDYVLKNEIKLSEADNAIKIEMENKGFVLTGSAMIRMLGDIYRAKDEVINDLDFIMSYQDFKNLDIDLAKMTDKELSQVPESEYIKKLSDVMSEKLGKEYVIKKAFVGPDHKGNKSVTLTYSKGNTVVDVFVRTSSSFAKEFENNQSIITDMLTNKLLMAKEKHITDYLYFRPRTELERARRSPSVQILSRLSLNENFEMKKRKLSEFFDLTDKFNEFKDDRWYDAPGDELLAKRNDELLKKIYTKLGKDNGDYLYSLIQNELEVTKRYAKPEEKKHMVTLGRVIRTMIPAALKNGIVADINFVDYKVDQGLDDYLTNWAKKYNIEIKNIKEFADAQTISLSGAVDVINKIIYLANSEDRNVTTMAEEVATMMVFMMGTQNFEINSALKQIKNYPKYNEEYLKYSNLARYKEKNENGVLVPNVKKINIEILTKAIAERLVIKYKARTSGNPFWEQVDNIINWFVQIFKGKKGLNLDVILDNIAEDILSEESSIIKPLPENYELKTYEQTIADNPQLVTLLDELVPMGFIPTGSLSYRNQLDTYRGKGEKIHDLDLTTTKFDSVESAIAAIKKVFPEFWIATYISPTTKKEGPKMWEDHIRWTATGYYGGSLIGKIGEDFEIEMTSDGKEVQHTVKNIVTGEILKEVARDADGNVYGGGVLIDLFVEKDRNQTFVVDDKGLAHYVLSYDEKLKYGRPKDAMDLVYAKNRRNVDLMDNQYIFYQTTGEEEQQDTELKEVYDTNPELASIGTAKQYSDYINSIFPKSQIKNIVYHASLVEYDKFKSQFPKGAKVPDFFGGFISQDMGSGFYFADKKNIKNWANQKTELNSLLTYNDELSYFKKLDEKINDWASSATEEEKKKVISEIEDIAFKKYSGFNAYKNAEYEYFQKRFNFPKPDFEKQKRNTSKVFPYIINVQSIKVVSDAHLAYMQSTPEALNENDSLIEGSLDNIEQGVIWNYDNNIHRLGDKEDVEGFKKFVKNAPTQKVDRELENLKDRTVTITSERSTATNPVKHTFKIKDVTVKNVSENEKSIKFHIKGSVETAKSMKDRYDLEELGYITVQKKAGNIAKISDIALYSPQTMDDIGKMKVNEGQGIGKYVYYLIGEFLKKRGLTLQSDDSISVGARKVWEYLVGQNKAVKLNNGVYQYTGDVIRQTPQQQSFQLEDMPMSEASASTIEKIKEACKKMGIKIEALVEYAKKTGLDTRTVNGVADLVRGIVAVAEGKEEVALTEEMVHLATAILEQTNPKMVTEMIAKIDRFKIYKQTLDAYKNKKEYQLPDGKPDIRKIKKEAVDKLIAELIINQNEGTTEFPELREEINRSLVRKLWDGVLDVIRGMYKSSNVNIFEKAARQIGEGQVGGTVNDIVADGVFFQTTDIQNKIQAEILNTKNSIDKIVGDPSKADPLLLDAEEANNFYEITNPDGTKLTILKRVTDRVKAWYEQRFRGKVFTPQEQAFNELKRKYGVQGHADLEEIHSRYYNKDGTKRDKPGQRPRKFNLPNEEMYSKLETYYKDLIKTFPKDTLIMSEVIIYDKKEKEAGTLDFLAIEPSGKAHILDWKFMHIKGDDVAWFKQGAFNIQLGRYKQMLKDNYGIKEFGMTRAIPISMEFKPINRFNIAAGFKLSGVAIGSVNAADIDDLRLVPISEEAESTGEEKLDELIVKLNALLKQIEKEEVTEDEREFKIERLNTLRQTIRIVQATNNIAPLIDTIEVMRKEGDKIINDYEITYKDKPGTSKDFKDKELSDFSDDMNNYIKLSSIFVDINRDIGSLLYSKDMEAKAKTKKQKEELKERKEYFEKLNEEANAIYNSRDKIKKMSAEFADKHIGQRNLVTGLLRPEAVIKGLSSLFRGVSDLPLASLNILYKVTRMAMGRASEDALKEVKEIMDIREAIIKKGGDVRKFIQQMYQKDDKGNIANKLIYKYSNKFRDTVDEKFAAGGDRRWILSNIDVEGYKKEALPVITNRVEQIKKQALPGTAAQVKAMKQKMIEEVLQKYDITRADFTGGDNYIIKRHPLPIWYSEEYKAVLKDSDLTRLFNFISEFNEKAKDVGYINNNVVKTFLPFVRKTMAEEISFDNTLSVMRLFENNLQMNVDDVGYGNVNKITGELENSIPKYYTHDFSKREDGVNDYSDVSEDLFKNLILYVQQVNKYKYMTEVEGQLKLVKTVEEFKQHHLNVNKRGDVVLQANGKPEKVEGNKENAKMYDEFLRVLLYDQKYILSDADTPLYIGKVFNFVKQGVNKVTGREIFKPNEEVTPTSLIKTVDSANRAFQVKTLGLEIIPGLVNLFGGNAQMAAQAGRYFRYREFLRNEKTITSMEFKNDEDKKIFIELMETFMPLKDDPAYEEYKKAGLTKLTQNNLGDMLMITMRYPEQIMEKATFLTLLENTMIVDGKMVNIREVVKKKYKNRYNSSSEYKSSKDNIEKEIDELQKTKSIAATRKLENGKLVIPGLDISDRTEVQRLTALSRRISRNAMGGISDGDINRMSMSVWTKSMMVFKGWIPKLADTRFSELRKISDDFSVEIKYDEEGNAYTEGQKYDIGRLRLLGYVMMTSFRDKASNITNIMQMNDAGLAALDKMYVEFAEKYKERTGEDFDMSKEDFIDMVRANLSNQLRELAVLASLLAASLALGFVAPDDDDDKATKNFYRYSQKVLDKFTSEISFFVNPLEFEKLLSGNMFPAIGLVTDMTKFLQHFWLQTTGLDFDPNSTFEEVREKAMPIKYAAKSLPVFKSVLTYLSLISSDFAKEFDITIQKESNIR